MQENLQENASCQKHATDPHLLKCNVVCVLHVTSAQNTTFKLRNTNLVICLHRTGETVSCITIHEVRNT